MIWMGGLVDIGGWSGDLGGWSCDLDGWSG